MLQWSWHSFEELSLNELYDILALREEVFALEQKCFYRDMDYFDQKAMHLQAREKNQLLGYIRLLPKDLVYPDAISFGRVIIAKSARNRGLGKELVEKTLLYLKENDNHFPIVIGAQLYLKRFYESFGFKTISEPFDEDGILHIKMLRQPS